ncbi:MAG: hypothetical protein U5R48_18195 [Gammaproteobacteria bacterium]|nr:hypothetical protein [Gammaproteobacteria bacterium]
MLGLWTARDGDSTRRLLILPLGPNEYLLSFPAGSDHALFARATPVKVDGRVLVQLRWLGSVAGKLPEDDRVYQYGRYRLTPEGLETGLVDPEVVPKDITTSAELRASLRAHLDDPARLHQTRTFTGGSLNE